MIIIILESMVFIICISSQNDSKEKKGTETSIKTFLIKHDVYDNIYLTLITNI